MSYLALFMVALGGFIIGYVVASCFCVSDKPDQERDDSDDDTTNCF